MKIEINATEQNMLKTALETQIATTQRQANTEKDGIIKEHREKTKQQYVNLKNKIMNGELDETTISKQK